MFKSRLRLSRFDLVAGTVALLLVITIALSALISQSRAPVLSASARIAYLGPTTGPFNIWLVDPAQPDVAPKMITSSKTGIFDFSVSADGRLIAYSEQQEDDAGQQIAELVTIDLQTGQTKQITNCAAQDAYCTTPVWRPDGKVMAYQRVELNTALGIGPSAPRIWILDMTREPYNTFQLFEDSQVLGTEPVWSKDGNKLVFYESSSQGVIVYDFAATTPVEKVKNIPAGNGIVGSLSPDGNQLVFPEILPAGETVPARAVLRVADLKTNLITSLTPEDEQADDNTVAWHPDGKRIALTRTYLDPERYTRGYQVYLMDMADDRSDGVLDPLVVDADYQHSAIDWSPDGNQLLVQRFKVINADVNTRPEIWVYSMVTKTLERVVTDGFNGRWVPGITDTMAVSGIGR